MPDAEGDAQGLLNGSSGLAGLAGSVAGGFAAGLAIFAVTVLRRRPAR
jgi:hypothetical protein